MREVAALTGGLSRFTVSPDEAAASLARAFKKGSLEGVEELGGVAQRQGVGRGEVLAAQPVLQLGVPLGLQRTLGELHHQQSPLHVQPVEEPLESGGAGARGPLSLLLHQVSPGAPEQALQDPLGLLDVDAFDGVGLEQQLGQPVEAGGVEGERRDGGEVLAAVVLLLQGRTHLERVGLVEQLVDQDARLELVELAVLGRRDDLGGQPGVVAFGAGVHGREGGVLGRAPLGLCEVADEESREVALGVGPAGTGAVVGRGLLGELGGPVAVGHQQQVLKAEVAVRDPVLLQVLQAVAELQEQEAHAALVNLRLSFVERLPLPDEVRRRSLGDLAGDNHDSLPLGLLARRGALGGGGGGRAGGGGLVRGQHALGDAGQKMPTVLLQVEVGGHGLLHGQAVQVALLGLRARVFADLEETKRGIRDRKEGRPTKKKGIPSWFRS